MNWLLEIVMHTVMIVIILYLLISGLTTMFLVLSFCHLYIWMPGKYELILILSIYDIG